MYQDRRQRMIITRLKTLDSVLASSAEPHFEEPMASREKTQATGMPIPGPELEKLESLMRDQTRQQNADGPDPELDELNGMLEKILDIQHPERVAQKLRAQSDQTSDSFFQVQGSAKQTPIGSLAETQPDSAQSTGPGTGFQTNGFFSLDETVSLSEGNAIKAVVHQEQTLVTGSTIKLRLTADIYVAATLIPKDSFIYGTVTVNGERLLVDISSIRLNNALFPVKLSVYDLDGQPGIYIPGSISRSVAKQAASEDVQGLSLGTLDPSLGAQAASAAVQTAGKLLGKKARLVQITVKAGYQILLKDGSFRPI
jgi:conjugative transposon TraM protein